MQPLNELNIPIII